MVVAVASGGGGAGCFSGECARSGCDGGCCGGCGGDSTRTETSKMRTMTNRTGIRTPQEC